MIDTSVGPRDEMARAQARAEAAARERERKVLAMGELFSSPEGKMVLEILERKVDSRIESPKIDNPTETIWYKEGQRSILRWIHSVTKTAYQLKQGAAYPQVNFDQEGF